MDRFLQAADQPLIVSDLAAVEVASALAIGQRDDDSGLGRPPRAFLKSSTTGEAAAGAELDLEPVDFRTAGAFVRRFDLGLRAPDALHAAACRRGDHTLVTLDQRMAAAAETLGVKVTCLG